MSVKNFIPTVWNDFVFQGYDKNLILGSLANRSYEGQVSAFGDSVRVNEIGDMSSSAYTGTVTYTDADDAQKVLQIDKKYYVAKKLDDVDAAQTKPKLMAEIGRKMGIAIADTIDQSVTALYDQAGVTSGTTGTPIAVNSANIIEYMSLMGQGFDDNSVPMDNRVAVVTPAFVHRLRLAGVDLKTDNTSVYENGFVANVMGWNVFSSRNIVHSSTTWYANMFFVAGETIALAEQINSMEAVRMEAQFADALRKLAVWGVKAMAPESLGVLYASDAAEA